MALTKLQRLALQAIQDEANKMLQALFELSLQHPGIDIARCGTDEYVIRQGIGRVLDLAEAVANPDK